MMLILADCGSNESKEGQPVLDKEELEVEEVEMFDRNLTS
jgi:hypothetical protein